ncbi:MAG: hypothetical protein Sapg2KO_49650 [Saprospiraceae bacterium]
MFSKACKYAIRAVLYLAVHTDKENKLGTKDIAEALEVPAPFLAKILQQLSRHHLLSSSKGTGGGFYLSDEQFGITLMEVIEVVDGPDVLNSCILGLPECSSEHPCPLHKKVISARIDLLDLIKNQTIEVLAKRINKKNLNLK